MPAGPGRYRGRFAPSPTGPLHAGSAVAALGSWLDARAAGGAWLIRIEDIDPPREIAGATDAILRDLELLGLRHDEAIVYQHTRLDDYAAVVQRLLADGAAFRCTCSRQDIVNHPVNAGRAPGSAPVYPGTCRDREVPADRPHAVRLRVGADRVGFDDRFQGLKDFDLAADCGDFVIRRRDGLYAYQLAVTVDDDWQRITDVVRGVDLIDSTPRQLVLRRQLGMPAPTFAHLPIVVAADGRKLSKQTGATALDLRRPGRVLVDALSFLDQRPPAGIDSADPGTILDWAVHNWRPARFAGIRSNPAPGEAFPSLPCSTDDR